MDQVADAGRGAVAAEDGSAFDALTAAGVLREADRARLAADQGTEHLARLLRAHEQAGADAAGLLRQAIETGPDLSTANSVAQVISARIQRSYALPTPAGSRGLPADVGPDRAGYLDQLRGLLDDRARDLGDQLATAAAEAPPAAGGAVDDVPGAEQPPAHVWAVAALGPVPADHDARAGWVARAGVLAAYREATGWEHPEQAIGRCPGVSTPEKRALWHEAFTAAGRPETHRAEAEMTTGRLLARVAAGDRVEAGLPAYVEDALAAHHARAADAERAAVLARAAGNDEEAARHGQAAAVAREDAARLETVHAARAERLAATLETRLAAQAAREELDRRGHVPGAEPDRTTAEEWLALEAEARQADDAHRAITEHDLVDDDRAVNDALEGPESATSAQLAPRDASGPVCADSVAGDQPAAGAVHEAGAEARALPASGGLALDGGAPARVLAPHSDRAAIAAAVAHAEVVVDVTARERAENSAQAAPDTAAAEDDWLRRQRTSQAEAAAHEQARDDEALSA